MYVCVFESYRWDGAGERVDGVSQSQQEGYFSFITEGREQKVHTLLPHQVGCHIRAVTWSHSQHVRRSEGSSLYYSDIKLKKKKKKKTNKNKTEESRRRRLQRRSGQVAVRVLLPVHSLQVLLLYQDVDAFLSTRGRQNPNMTTCNQHLIDDTATSMCVSPSDFLSVARSSKPIGSY